MPPPERTAAARPRLPSPIYRDLKAASGPQLDHVITAYVDASTALVEGDAARAIELLGEAKRRASRSAVLREALGIALYRSGQFKDAGRELATYRRLSGRLDQNHLLADCARAAGQVDKAEELVEQMLAADVPADRKAEGLLVVAGARADDGDHAAALAALHRMDLEPRVVEPHHLRLWYLAAELEERRGDPDAAHGYLQAIATVDPDFLDVAERLSGGDDEAQEGSSDPSSARVRQ